MVNTAENNTGGNPRPRGGSAGFVFFRLLVRGRIGLLAGPASVAAVLVALAWSSGNAGEDTTPPAAISDLRMANPKTVKEPEMVLEWTAPGDDGVSGRAARYEVYAFTSGFEKPRRRTRRQARAMAEKNLGEFTRYPCDITPGPAGSTERLVIRFEKSASRLLPKPRGPAYFQSYWLVIAVDEAGNRSAVPPVKDEVMLLADACEECHDDREKNHLWPQRTGKHLKHVISNHFKCVMCHRKSVDEYMRFRNTHDNGRRDVVMARFPTRRIFNPETGQCAKACHKPRNWFKKSKK